MYGAEADERVRAGAYRADDNQTWRYWAGNVSITKKIWDRIGPYDDHYQAYGWEDVDYGWRLHQAGIPIVVDPALATRHHAAAVSTLARVSRSYRSGQARRTFDEIHGPGTSGAVRPVDDNMWNQLVCSTVPHLSYRRSHALAKSVDAALPGIPAPVARKAIALLVEASGIAGYETTETAERDF